MIHIDQPFHLHNSPRPIEPLESLTIEGNMRIRPRRRNSRLASAKVSRKDSFLVALSSIDRPGSNFRKSKRNSFLIASEILGFNQNNQTFDEATPEKKDEPVFYDTSRRSSTNGFGKLCKRDSFLDTMESFELPNLNSKQRRVSQILLSELLDLESSNNFNSEKGLKGTRRDSLLSLSSLSKKDSFTFSKESFPLPASTPSQKCNSFFMNLEVPEVQRSLKRKRQSTRTGTSLTCFDTDFSKNLDDQDSKCPRKTRRISSLDTSSMFASQHNSSISNDSIQKNDDSNKHQTNQDCEQINQSASGNPTSKLISLCQAMRSSEESQTRIHDWDKKMGLRRSHSKTMRNSMRSREELLKFCSNQIFMTL